MNKLVIGLMIITSCFAGCNQQIEQIEQWDVYEAVLNGPSSGTPFTDVELSAVFKMAKGMKKVLDKGFRVFMMGTIFTVFDFHRIARGIGPIRLKAILPNSRIRKENSIVSHRAARITVP